MPVNAFNSLSLLTRSRHEVVGTVVKVGSKVEGGLKYAVRTDVEHVLADCIQGRRPCWSRSPIRGVPEARL